ncbi:MAG: hypothetical protein ACKO1Y_00895 [Actinomycetota bacterium]
MPDESGVSRRTKWDAKADAARADLVAEGIARILEEALGAIAGLVSPSALARRSEEMSVDRAYRLLGDPESTLRRIMTSAADPDFRADAIGWPTFDEVSSAAVAEAATETALEATTAAVRHYLERNFRLPSCPLGRIIAAVTLTASPAWQGTITVSDEHRALAEELAEIDRRGALALRAHMRWLLLDALGTLRRRPRPGMTLDLIVELALALANGSLDRMFVEPAALTIDEAVDALVSLTVALTEEGSPDDPREPNDARAADAFASLVRAAEAHWLAGGTIPDLDSVVAFTGTDGTEVATWFPSVAALADSVLRSRLAGRGAEPGAPVTMLGLLRADLRRVAETADAMPEVVRLAGTVEPERSVLVELRAAAAACAAEQRTDGRLAEQLVATAGLGTAHWATTEVLLDLLVGR